MRQTSKTVIAEPFSKISKKRKISKKQFHHYERKIVLKKVTNSINSLTTKFYKHLSNELNFNVY